MCTHPENRRNYGWDCKVNGKNMMEARQVTFTWENLTFDDDGEGAGVEHGDASKGDYSKAVVVKPWKTRLLQNRCQSLDVASSSLLLPYKTQDSYILVNVLCWLRLWLLMRYPKLEEIVTENFIAVFFVLSVNHYIAFHWMVMYVKLRSLVCPLIRPSDRRILEMNVGMACLGQKEDIRLSEWPARRTARFRKQIAQSFVGLFLRLWPSWESWAPVSNLYIYSRVFIVVDEHGRRSLCEQNNSRRLAEERAFLKGNKAPTSEDVKGWLKY